MAIHINDNNEAKPCRAQTTDSCKFQHNGNGHHFDSYEEAEQYLAQQEDGTSGTFTKSNESPIVMDLSPHVDELVHHVSEVGQPYIVGGAVRDAINGDENKDVDIEVHQASFDDIATQLRQAGYNVDEVGQQFGVLKVSKSDGTDFDVSVPRRENKTGAAHTDFTVDFDPSMTVDEAAERRDFTFNSIMYDPVNHTMVDSKNGYHDFKNGVMTHVSDQFQEDPLRVMRGFQFAARFSMAYSPHTAQLTQNLRPEYSTLSTERIREEWTKFYNKGVDHMQGVRALQQSGWDDTQPGLRDALHNQSVQHGLNNLSHTSEHNRELVGASMISSSMSDDNARNFARATTSSYSEADRVMALRDAVHSDLSTTAQRKHQALSNSITFRDIDDYAQASGDTQLNQAAQAAYNEGVYEAPERDILDGHGIMAAADKKPGKWMKEAVSSLRDQQYHGNVTTPDEARDFIRQQFA